jgi:hypothetical protein
MNKSNNNTRSDNINSSESVIMMKKKDYNNIIDKIVDNQHTIDVLSKLIYKSSSGKININDMKKIETRKLKTVSDKSSSSIFKKKNDDEEKV